MKFRFILPVLFIISCSLGSFSSCKEPASTGPENRNDSLVLKFKESDLTNAVLSLHTAGITLPATLSFNRIDGPSISFILYQADTTLKDSLLTPSTTYSWRVEKSATQKSNLITGRTMDTTSHEFTWDIQYIGGYHATELWDIVMVNDTLAFAVGEIYTDPATDPDDGIYKGEWNVAMWNGKVWQLMKLYSVWNGSPYFAFLKWVCVIDQNHVWFSNSMKWDGKQFIYSDLIHKAYQIPIPISHMWGNSPKNIYAVGLKGEAAHWDGTSWTVITTGSALQFFDIWGDGNEVLAVSASWTNADKKVFSLSPSSAKEIDLTGVPYQVYSAWFQKDKKWWWRV